MEEPIWLDRGLVDLFHEDLIRSHGGSFGMRDPELLESALARPRQRFHYDPGCDLAALAASLGFGLAKNHPYVDGNKRLAFAAMGAFLDLNALEIEADEAEVVAVMLDLAAGALTEEDLAKWVRLRSVKRAGG